MNEILRVKNLQVPNKKIDVVLETEYSTGDVFTGEIYTKLGSCKKRCIIKIFTN